jgi:hypothetical protein
MAQVLVLLSGAVLMHLPFNAAAASDKSVVLSFHTMVGVFGPFLGTANPIRGVPGGGLPWVLDEGRGELKADGSLEVRVKGLIIPASAGLGFNPVPFFKAIVSCISVDNGNPVDVNVTTNNGAEVMIGDPRNGNALIEADLDLPDPCIAPIVFVTSPTGAWFAVTGVEQPKD